MIEGFGAANVKILWTFWGLDNFDLLTIPPAFKSSFSANGSDLADQPFGADMNIVDGGPAGRKLVRGYWNVRPYGVLNDLKNGGLAAGADLYFNKNRLSGLWVAQTPLGLWLQEDEMTTLLFGGVNADQCVYSTFIDAYFKGQIQCGLSCFLLLDLVLMDYNFDVVYVDDISATTSPDSATQMVLYNGDAGGFVGNSAGILKALKSQA